MGKNWFSEYCGLGESSGLPEHSTDGVCKRHDENYVKIIKEGGNPYWTWNWADEQMLNELKTITSGSVREYIVNKAGQLFTQGKKLLPTLKSQSQIDAEQQAATMFKTRRIRHGNDEIEIDPWGGGKVVKKQAGESSLGNKIARPTYTDNDYKRNGGEPLYDSNGNVNGVALRGFGNAINGMNRTQPRTIPIGDGSGASDNDSNNSLPSLPSLPSPTDINATFGNQPRSGNMDIDQTGASDGSGDSEMRVANMSTGGNPQSRETPISPYPALPYGLQETHTTIIPFAAWISVVKLDYTATDVLLRMNTPGAPLSNTVLGATPTTATSVQTYKAQNNDVPNTNSLTFPATWSAATQCAWSDYWAKIYQQYTVLGCEWQVVMRNAREAQNGDAVSTNRDALLAYEYDSSGTGDTGNVIPSGSALKRLQQWKGINWKTVPSSYGQGHDTIITGTYKPGQIKQLGTCWVQ